MSRAFNQHPIPTRLPNSSHTLPFSTSFIFSLSRIRNRLGSDSGYGFAFLFAPFSGINGTNQVGYFGLPTYSAFNLSSHVFAITFDLTNYRRNNIHLVVNSLTYTRLRGYDPINYNKDGGNDAVFLEIQPYNEGNYQVWIDYMNSQINVTVARVGMTRPSKPLITGSINLSEALLGQMYLGFSAASDVSLDSQRILSWSFSNSNFSIADALITKHLPSFVTLKDPVITPSKGFIIGVSIGGLFVTMCGYITYKLIKKTRNTRKVEELENWETEYWPHRIEYQDIHNATKGFAEQNVIGYGANGNVYRGFLQGGIPVAIKRISLESEHGMREFLAEISSLGRLRHRNLVGLRGWCRTQKKGLILVYDFMDCGSLDKWLFGSEDNVLLDWQLRIKILKDVASGILYLHEGWEARVLHRDIKASNVLLDKDMNARLGDFGLARVYHNGQPGETTRVIGTVGYMAPELVHNGRASAQTDVYSFGIMILEVVCRRRPIEVGKQSLINWVNDLMQEGKLADALDKSLKENCTHIEDEVDEVLRLGLLCTNPEPNARPSMRQILKALEKRNEKQTPQSNQIEINSAHNKESIGMWSNYRQNLAAGRSTYKDTEKALLYCISLNASDVILEGR